MFTPILLALLGADIKLTVFNKKYNKLASVLPIKSLTSHLAKENIINSEEEEKILRTISQTRAASIVLRKIRKSLRASSTENFDALMSIMEQNGDTSCLKLVSEMRQDLAESTINGKVVIVQ